MSENKSNKGIIIVLVVLILLLGGAVAYLFMKTTDQEQIIVTKTEYIEKKEQQSDSLSQALTAQISEFEALSAQYEQMGINNDSLKSSIEALQSDLTKWKARASKSNGDIEKLKKDLQAKLDANNIALEEKNKEIDRLKKLSDSLHVSVNQLVQEKGTMGENISALEKQVAIASILRAEHITVTVVTAKQKELETKEPVKAKSIDKVKIKFNVGDNKVAKHEKKTFLLRVIEPSGSVLYDGSTGGGSFTTAEGKETHYTSKYDLDFTNGKQTVTYFYQKGGAYNIGKYSFEIYCEGHLIGTSSMMVK